MSSSESSSQLVSPVVRGLRLLRYIADGGSTANLSEVGRAIDVNRVTVMRLLATLEHENMIERLPQGGHRVGFGFLSMAAAAVGEHDLVAAGRRAIAALCREFDLSAYLVMLDGDEVVYMARAMPDAGLVSHIKVGSRVPAHLTAPGRAMLATMSEAEIERRYAGRALTPVTRHNPVDRAALIAILADDRRRGCAWSFSGYEEGIDACAAAICDSSGKAVAALSVVGPENVVSRREGVVERVGQAVMAAARELGRIEAVQAT